MRRCGILSVVFKTPKCTSHLGFSLGGQPQGVINDTPITRRTQIPTDLAGAIPTPRSNRLNSAAGTCRYCHQKAGILARDHPLDQNAYCSASAALVVASG